MFQKVILRKTDVGEIGYPISDVELEKMLKAGTAVNNSTNPYIFEEVTGKAESESEPAQEQRQVYNTRDMVAQPGTRRTRRQRRLDRVKDED